MPTFSEFKIEYFKDIWRFRFHIFNPCHSHGHSTVDTGRDSSLKSANCFHKITFRIVRHQMESLHNLALF